MTIVARRRFSLRLLVPFIVFLFILVSWHLSSSESSVWVRPRRSKQDADGPFSPQLIRFWSRFSQALLTARPDCPTPERPNGGGPPRVRFSLVKENDTLPDLMHMPREDVLSMKAAHDWIVDQIKNHVPPLHYKPGTRGIVTTAGGEYLPTAAISIRMLRRTGSRLPVEVFLASNDEYEPQVCEDVFPGLNARCLILSDVLDAAPTPLRIERYQYKIFAMIFSSFEDIIFIDADDIAMHKPETLFDLQPYLSTGMVTWPDFWPVTTSPLYYDIASLPPPNLAANPSTESGQIYISRKTHASTLLLATYYNLYGPSHYYPLFSQGADGEGDKETFLAAATVMNSSFYQVHEPVSALGFFEDGEFHGTAMVQYNPFDDYIYSRNRSAIKPHSPRPFFVHANYPKVNPGTLLNDYKITHDLSGRKRRIWGSEEQTRIIFGFDVERMVWEDLVWTGCELEHVFNSWENKSGICENAKEHWNEVFENAKTTTTLSR